MPRHVYCAAGHPRRIFNYDRPPTILLGRDIYAIRLIRRMRVDSQRTTIGPRLSFGAGRSDAYALRREMLSHKLTVSVAAA